ncbi:MAG TPA: hypothetical protein VF006_12450 [Longimicrobium sp.]
MTAPLRDGRVQAALAAAALALVIAGGALRRALEVEPLPAARAPAEADTVAAVTARLVYPAEYLTVAVSADPFRPERAPAPSYVLPGEAAALAAAEAQAPAPAYEAPLPPAPALRLLGTMLTPGGRPVALLEESGVPARMVRLGERIGTHTLTRVEPGRAVLRSAAGETLELRVARPGS